MILFRDSRVIFTKASFIKEGDTIERLEKSIVILASLIINNFSIISLIVLPCSLETVSVPRLH